MRDNTAEDTHSTLGRRFRTPAHPEILSALGRVLYNFLSLEESVTAILYDSGFSTLSASRAKMAGAKEKELKTLANLYRESGQGEATAAALDHAAETFGQVRKTVRNELLHAHPYTVGKDKEGKYLPGLAYTTKDAASWKTLVQEPRDLLNLASEIENAIDPLSEARRKVQMTPLSTLSEAEEP